MPKPNYKNFQQLKDSVSASRVDLNQIKYMEIERSNTRLIQAASQKPKEHRHMKQNFFINQQGPSHGPNWKRNKPHTLIFHNKTRSNGSAYNLIEQPSAVSLTISQKASTGAYKKCMTEITMLAQDYNRTWNKIQKYQPVLTTNKMMTTFDTKAGDCKPSIL